MAESSYLRWIAEQTPTAWWHDSGDPEELERGYEAVLLVAAMRGNYHMTELAGGELILSIHPKYQDLILQSEAPREQRIDAEVDPKAIEQLRKIHEFVRAFEPDGMAPEEFITFGVTQKTLTQFYHSGWALLESYEG